MNRLARIAAIALIASSASKAAFGQADVINSPNSIISPRGGNNTVVNVSPTEQDPRRSVAIHASCFATNLPIRAPAHSVVRIIPANPTFFSDVHEGMQIFVNNSDEESQVPDKNTMNELTRQRPRQVFAWKCEISNHGTSNAVNVAIDLSFWFGNTQSPDMSPAMFKAMIGSVDLGKSVDFYIVNDCPRTVFGSLPDTVRVRTAASENWFEATLFRDFSSPVEQIFALFPGSKNWLGDAQCGT